MRARTLNFLRSLRKFSAVGTGVAASMAAAVVAVKAASSSSSSSSCSGACGDANNQKQYHIPESDHPPFRKWNFNWDRMDPQREGSIWPVNTGDGSSDSCNCRNSCPDCNCRDNGNANWVMEDYYPIKARRNLILIRHGQYNTTGDDDCSHTLTELGQQQAVITGKKLASMGIKFNSITSSTMKRAIQTATIILENIDCENKRDLKLEIKDPLLCEGTPCIPEPPYRKPELWNPPERVKIKIQDVYMCYQQVKYDMELIVSMIDYQDVLVDGSRIETGFRKYFHRAEPTQEQDTWEIIVCHGNVIRYFTCRALQFPPEGWLRISLDHCSMTRFTILPTGEVILRGLGDSGHIPYDKATVVNAGDGPEKK